MAPGCIRCSPATTPWRTWSRCCGRWRADAVCVRSPVPGWARCVCGVVLGPGTAEVPPMHGAKDHREAQAVPQGGLVHAARESGGERPVRASVYACRGGMHGVVHDPWCLARTMYLAWAQQKEVCRCVLVIVCVCACGGMTPRRAVQAQERAVEAVLQILPTAVVRNVLFMGLSEMHEIAGPPDICADTEAKTVMYIGSAEKEKWVTEDNIAEIKAKYRSTEIHRCDEGIAHAFVLDASARMARKTWAWIAEAARLQPQRTPTSGRSKGYGTAS
eukprot:m.992789 g.992789  ORF g.992789 m.992789 type:complete len:274 (+) comp24007_c0_seq11:1645-2466(+)